MDECVIVDLSDEDDTEKIKKRNRKKFNEIKKYIPFLQYLKVLNPVENEKYVRLLSWFSSNKELPLKTASICELAIRRRYRVLKSTVDFPPKLISIFEGKEEAIVLLSDDDDDNNQPTTTNNISLSSKEKSTNGKATENTSKSNEVKDKNSTTDNDDSSKKSTTTKTIAAGSKLSESTSKCVQNAKVPTAICPDLEEGEIISDCEDLPKEKKKITKTRNISLSEILLKDNQTKECVVLEDNDDDIINQELFNKIDDLDAESARPVSTTKESWKDLEKDESSQPKKSPISKNLEPVRCKSPDLLSDVSDDDNFPNETLKHKNTNTKHKLVNKMDDLATEEDSGPVATPPVVQLSLKDPEKDESVQPRKSPILKPKNLEPIRRKSPEPLSDISDEDNTLNGTLKLKKKNKKHKHRKKSHYVSDSNGESETENNKFENNSDMTESARKRRKSFKKKIEKLQVTRTLYVSDDEDELLPNTTPLTTTTKPTELTQVEPIKKPDSDSDIFQRRDLKKETTPPTEIVTEASTPGSTTVVLLDSDEEEINAPPVKVVETKLPKPTLVLQPKLSPKETTSVPSTNSIVMEKAPDAIKLEIPKKVEFTSPSKVKDLNSMNLNELNDIYLKLCERTGIQLEELLGELVNKSTITIEDDDSYPETIQDTKISSSIFDIDKNSVSVSDGFEESQNVQEDEFHKQRELQQQQQLLHHQQQRHYHQRQQMYEDNLMYQQQQEFHHHQQQEQQQFQQHQQQQQQQFSNHLNNSSNQMHNNNQPMYNQYQNSMVPRLNLNDPRIVQKLKQIQDSPIHNLSIRESATLLMKNCNNQRPSNRTVPPPAKVTSNTATTYGEHKRLKELEKQKLLELQKAKQNAEKERNNSPVVVQGNVPKTNVPPKSTVIVQENLRKTNVSPKLTAVMQENVPQTDITTKPSDSKKKSRKNSSGSESGQNILKPTNEKETTSTTKQNRKRKNSSASESGRITPKSPTDAPEDEETVIMSFPAKSASKRRIESASSDSNDTVDLQHDELQQVRLSTENKLASLNMPFEVEKVVQIVMNALGKAKEDLILKPTKSRKNSSRKSTDSIVCDEEPPKSTNIEKERNQTEETTSVVVNSGKGKAKRARRKTIDHNSIKTPPKTKPSQSKRCRELDNLNCTFKEYSDMFEKYLLPTIDGKRLCSNSSASTKQNQTSPSSSNETPEKIIKNNESSDSDKVASTCDIVRAAPIAKRRQTCSAMETPPKETYRPLKVCFRRLSSSGRFSVENKNNIELSDDTDEFDIEEHNINTEFPKTYKNVEKDPFNPYLKVRLQRLTLNEIMKWRRMKKEEPVNLFSNTDQNVSFPVVKPSYSPTPVSIPVLKKAYSPPTDIPPKNQDVLIPVLKRAYSPPTATLPRNQNVSIPVLKKAYSPPALIPQRQETELLCKPIEMIEIPQKAFGMPVLVPFTSKPVDAPKKSTSKVPTRLNTDLTMTLNSTKVCALCNKRPNDLTNHYIAQHKTESYTSRLTAAEIENLELNITLAVPHRNRFKIICPLCPDHDELEDSFVNFHAHFSFHTGEYGFKCDVCDMVKPFREDIRCHQQRTSACRNGRIRSNYVYAPDLVVIYLYVCNLCNFVQLNEANVYKHQRDHHGIRFEEPQNLKKIIIAAKDNGEVLNENMPTDQEEDELNQPNEEKNTLNVEQEFVSEHPIDIKDVLLTEEQSQPTTAELSLFEKLLREIDVDSETIASIAVSSSRSKSVSEAVPASPSKPASNVMTVVHTSKEEKLKENHKPYTDEDVKPDIKNIKLQIPAEEQFIKPKMIYRRMPLVSNYFGMYKCTFNDCWFSTNEANTFFIHTSTAHNNSDRRVFMDCAYCPFKSTKARNIVGHVRAKHIMCRYQCAECAYRSTIPGNVAIHRQLFHKDSTLGKCIYECASRVKDLEEKLNDLTQKMVSNIASLKCADCSESFYAISSLKTHVRKKHLSTFGTLDFSSFKELVCLHCKEESNDKEKMRIHLALNHPDEIGYVAERKIKSKFLADAVQNLNLINVSLPVAPNDIHDAPNEEEENTVLIKDNSKTDSQTLTEDAPPAKAIKLMENVVIPKPQEIKIDEDVSLLSTESSSPMPGTQVPAITELDKRVKLLLEMFTESTGAPSSSLYRCPKCIASFLHYELWKKHVTNRHKIHHTVPCPYCSTQIQINSGEMHFESHRRHEYICFHCVASFCSRAKICDHFTRVHSEFKATREQKISFADSSSFYIFKQKDPLEWSPVMFDVLGNFLRLKLKEKLAQNQCHEWRDGISDSCEKELDIPQYVNNDQPLYKCLIRSCPFIGSNENDLDVHMNVHNVPDIYTCSHCAIIQNDWTWETMKNHKMLHKENIYICCVCSFIYHTLPGTTKHIEQFHKFRDVPVISVCRNDKSTYKSSITFFLPENKISFATTDMCFCCRKIIKRSDKLVYHLKKDHKITCLPKCEICDTVILTRLDAEAHAKEEHQMETFKIKLELTTTFLYSIVVTSIVPFIVENRLVREKRPSQDPEASLSKKAKAEEGDAPVKIKEEIVVKTECEEMSSDAPSTSLKCVNLQNLMGTEDNTKKRIISIKTMSALIAENLQPRLQPFKTDEQSNYTVIRTPDAQTPQEPSINLLPQGTLTNTNLLSHFRPQDLQLPLNAQLQHMAASSSQLSMNTQLAQNNLNLHFDPVLPELIPICKNCNFECTDFSHLRTHFETVHAYKNVRFLFKIDRKIECVYCSFRCSLGSFSKHHQTFHRNKVCMCRSVIDSRRCGFCDKIFSSSLLNKEQKLPSCDCPENQRLLEDCVDQNTIQLLQNVGENFFEYTCAICKKAYKYTHECKEHIIKAHNVNIDPIITAVSLMCVCNVCGASTTSIEDVIDHVKKTHVPANVIDPMILRMCVYNKITVIFPKGLTIRVSDLKNTNFCYADSFTRTIHTFEMNVCNAKLKI